MPVSLKLLLDASGGITVTYGGMGAADIPEIANAQVEKLQFSDMPEGFFASREKAAELFKQIWNTDDYQQAVPLYLQIIEQSVYAGLFTSQEC